MIEELPGDDYDPQKRLEELLRAARGIELETLPLSSVKLSRFTLKQISRSRPVKRVKKKKMHYNTRRKKKRLANNSKRGRYLKFKSLHGEAWKITEEDWDLVWDFVGDRKFRLGRYSKAEPFTLETIWIEDKISGEKLWEGYEDRLRDMGILL